jgi:hypothetical protein
VGGECTSSSQYGMAVGDKKSAHTRKDMSKPPMSTEVKNLTPELVKQCYSLYVCSKYAGLPALY